jgi:hypothetical protein
VLQAVRLSVLGSLVRVSPVLLDRLRDPAAQPYVVLDDHEEQTDLTGTGTCSGSSSTRRAARSIRSVVAGPIPARNSPGDTTAIRACSPSMRCGRSCNFRGDAVHRHSDAFADGRQRAVYRGPELG